MADLPSVISAGSPEEAQLQNSPTAVSAPTPAPAASAPPAPPSVIAAGSPEEAQLTSTPPDSGQAPAVISADSPAASFLTDSPVADPTESDLTKLSRDKITESLQHRRAMASAAGLSPDSVNAVPYENAYATRAGELNMIDGPIDPGNMIMGLVSAIPAMTAGAAVQAGHIGLLGASVASDAVGHPILSDAEEAKTAATLKRAMLSTSLSTLDTLHGFAASVWNRISSSRGAAATPISATDASTGALEGNFPGMHGPGGMAPIPADDRAKYIRQMRTSLSLKEASANVASGNAVGFNLKSNLGLHPVGVFNKEEVDPEAVQQIQSSPGGDPVFLATMLGGEGAAGEAAARAPAATTLGKAVADAAPLTAGLPARTLARTAEIMANSVRKGAAVFENLPAPLKAVTSAALAHFTIGGSVIVDFLAGMAGLGEEKGGIVAKTATKIAEPAEKAAAALRQTTPILSPGPVTQFISKVGNSATDTFVSSALAQAPFLPFAIGNGDPEKFESTVVGGFVAAAIGHTAGKASQMSIIPNMWHEATRAPGERANVTEYGTSPELDAMHQAALNGALPVNNEGVNLIEAARGTVKKGGAELYVGKPEDIAQNLLKLNQRGVTFFDPATGAPVAMDAATAKTWSEQNGVNIGMKDAPTTDATGAQVPGVKRNVSFIPFNESTPGMGLGHETWHAIEATMSPEERQHYYDQTIQTYGPDGIEQYRQDYASRIPGRIINDPKTGQSRQQTVREVAAGLDDNRVASELLAEHASGRMNAIPVGAFGPSGEMQFKNPAWRRYVRDTSAMVEGALKKIGAKIPEGNAPRSGLGWELSSRLGRVVDNIIEARQLESGIADKQGNPDPHTETFNGPTKENPIVNVREVAPIPAFKKGDPIGEVRNDAGDLIAKGALVNKVIADPQGNHQYEIEFTDPADGKRKVGIVPEKFLQSPVREAGAPAPESPATVETATTPTTAATAEAPAATTATPAANATTNPATPAANVRVTPAQQQAAAGREATPAMQSHNTAVLKGLVARPRNQIPMVESPETLSAKAEPGEIPENAAVRKEQRMRADRAEQTGFVNPLRTAYQKLFVPYRLLEGPTPRVFAFSLDKLIDNVSILHDWATQNGHPELAARLGSPTLRTTVERYLENQRNGFGGDGTKLTRTASTRPGSITPETPGYKPHHLSLEDKQLANLLMGVPLPQRATPATHWAAGMARENGLSPITDARGVEVTNPLYSDLVKGGLNPKILNSVVENLPVKKFTTPLKVRDDLNSSAGDVGITQAGFMPKNPLTEGVHSGMGDENKLKMPGDRPLGNAPGQPNENPTPRLAAPYSAKDDGGFVVKPRLAEPIKKRTGLFSTLEHGETKYMPKVEDRDIKQSLDKPGWAIVTATKEADGPATGEKNIAANEALRAQLEASGHDVTEVGGSYKGIDQGKSFLVRGISEPEALKLAQEHGQESILTHRGLVYQDGSVHPMDPSKTKFGAEALKQDAYTTLPDGTAFAADINFEHKVPSDLNRYKEIQTEMVQMIKDGKVSTPEFKELWQENEDIKNRQPDPGMPPKETAPTTVKRADDFATSGTYDVTIHHADGTPEVTKIYRDPETTNWYTEDGDLLSTGTRVEAIKKLEAGAKYMPKTSKPLEHSVGNKELKLVHYGDQGMKAVDPKQFGKSGLTPRSELSGSPRVYFYEKGHENPHDPVLGRGAKYETTVDGGKIYDGDKDPLNYGSIVNREKADQMLQDAGYGGIRRTSGSGKNKYSQVELYKKTPVTPAGGTYMPKASPAQESALKDSKVRGPDGKLLPLFHGTYSEFKKFKQGDLGYHFGTEDAANSRIGDAISKLSPGDEIPAHSAFDAYPEMRANMPPGARGALENLTEGARTIPSFLDIKNPLRMRDVGPWDQPEQVYSELPQKIKDKLDATTGEAVDTYTRWRDNASRSTLDSGDAAKSKVALTAIREGLKSLGYDGVVYKNDFEAGAAAKDSYIAFDGKQIVPAYAHDAKARFMPKAVSTVPIVDGSEPKPGIGSLAFEIGKGLADRSRTIKRIPHDSRTAAAKDAISDTIVDEIGHALSQHDNARGWYEATVTKAMDKFAEIHPELKTDPDRSSLFKVLLAITSNGQKVGENAHRADAIYQGWKDTGRIDATANWGGARKNQINKGLEMLQKLVDEKGLPATAEFLNKKVTVGELKKMGFGISGEAVDHVVRGAAIFGPKVGAGFYANLQGDFSPVTMDLWLMRTWNRINGSYGVSNPEGMGKAIADLRKAAADNPKSPEALEISDMSDRALGNWAEKRLSAWTKNGFKNGTAFDRPAKRFSESKEGAIESPRNSNERAWVREVFAEVDKKLSAAGLPEINNADKQALLWYYEKDLYSHFGYRKRAASAQDYATAAADVVARRTANAAR